MRQTGIQQVANRRQQQAPRTFAADQCLFQALRTHFGAQHGLHPSGTAALGQPSALQHIARCLGRGGNTHPCRPEVTQQSLHLVR